MADEQYDVNLTGSDVIEFIRDHEREGANILEGVQKCASKALAKWKLEGKDQWPTNFRLEGPRPIRILTGPLSGQLVQIYQFSIYAAPVNTVSHEEATKQLEIFFLGLRIENDELVECVEELSYNA